MVDTVSISGLGKGQSFLLGLEEGLPFEPDPGKTLLSHSYEIDIEVLDMMVFMSVMQNHSRLHPLPTKAFDPFCVNCFLCRVRKMEIVSFLFLVSI